MKYIVSIKSALNPVRNYIHACASKGFGRAISNGVNKILDKAVGPLEMAVLGIIVISTLSYALAWQAPGGNPPASNTDAPLNVGLDAQIKGGNLVVNALGVTASGNALLVPNGNVGIGTTSPSYKLDVRDANPAGGLMGQFTSSAPTNPYVRFGTNNNVGDIRFGNDNTHAALLHTTGGWQWNTQLNIMNGNVGIGTTSPSWKLDVFGGGIRAQGDVRGERLCIGGDCRSSWPDSTPPPSTPPPSTPPPPPPTPLYQCPFDDRRREGQCNFNCFGTISTSSFCIHSADYESCNSEIRQCTPL